MILPTSFAGMPTVDLANHFRNVCIEFKKTIRSSQDLEQLEISKEHFRGLSKEMSWPANNSEVYHKNVGEKAVNKVLNAYKRYIEGIKHHKVISSGYLIDAISDVERLIKR